MISQGASEINMSFMIDEDDADEAVRSLHAAFFQDPDPEIFDVEARKQLTVNSAQCPARFCLDREADASQVPYPLSTLTDPCGLYTGH